MQSTTRVLFVGMSLALLLFSVSAKAAETAATAKAVAEKKTTAKTATSAEVAAACRKHFVQVRVWARKDTAQGDRPDVGMFSDDLSEERPTLLGGYLWSKTEVMIPDFVLHDRFIRKIEVEAGGKTVTATVQGYYEKHQSMLLTLPEVLPGVVPLIFSPAPPRKVFGKLRVVRYYPEGDRWLTSIGGAVQGFSQSASGASYLVSHTGGILVAPGGEIVGVNFADQMSLTGDEYPWQGQAVRQSAFLRRSEKWKRLATLRTRLFQAAPEVNLTFRAEVEDNNQSRPKLSSHSRRGAGNNNDDAHEIKATGFLIAPNRLLVPIDLPRNLVQKLKSIEVRFYAPGKVSESPTAEGRFPGALIENKVLRRAGTFAGSLRHVQGILIDVAGEPLPGVLDLNTKETFSRGEIFLKCFIDHSLGKRRERFAYDRYRGTFRSYRGLPGVRTFTNEDDGSIAFSLSGKLLGLAIAHQMKPSSRDRYRSSPNAMFRPISTIQKILAAADAIDENIKPVAKKEENRMVHLGVEWQKMDRNLARHFKAAKETRGGEIGFLVTFVYPDSPAAKAKLQPGDILLRLHDPDRAEPLDLLPGYSRARGFYYDRFLTMPSDQRAYYAERMPPPWPVRINALTKLLTALGEGKKVTVDYLRAGTQHSFSMTTTQAPPDFLSAHKFKDKTFGLTVKRMTYETRLFLKRDKTSTAVIVAKVEAGSKAAVAGIYKYQLITRLNGKPFKDFEAFKTRLTALAKQKGAVEFTLEMMGKTRLVIVEM